VKIDSYCKAGGGYQCGLPCYDYRVTLADLQYE